VIARPVVISVISVLAEGIAPAHRPVSSSPTGVAWPTA
jgi:hypothetical protein